MYRQRKNGPYGSGGRFKKHMINDGECRCPNCGHREPHQIGVPCYHKICPKCNAPMTRA